MLLGFNNFVEREVDRRLHERLVQKEQWEHMERLEKRVEELRWRVECMENAKREAVPVNTTDA